MSYLWTNPMNTMKIFNFLNHSENTNMSGGSKIKPLSDLEFDSEEIENITGGNESEYNDALLPTLISNIDSESSNRDIEKDIENTIEQNMSLKTLEEIYGKRDSINLNDNSDDDLYFKNIDGGNDSDVDDDSDDDDDSDVDEYALEYDFGDAEAINDEEVQEDVKEFEDLYSVQLDNDDDSNNSDDEIYSNIDKDKNKNENKEVQEGGESINKIVENLGDNDEEAYIKGCSAKNLSGGNTEIKTNGFKFYPYK